MMRVEWQPIALNELADIWMRADSSLRRAVNEQVQEIDRELAQDPFNTGESRLDDVRLAFFSPLTVEFFPDADSQTVTVLHVRIFQRRRRK